MTSTEYEIPASWDDLDDPDWTASTAGAPSFTIEPQKTSFVGKCGNAFACVCGTGGGFALSHAGCAASYILTFSGVGLATTFSASSIALATSLTLTGAGVGVWHMMRGKTAGIWERRLTLGGAVAGAALSLSLHFSGATGHIHAAEQSLEYYRAQSPEEQNKIQEIAENQSIFDILKDLCAPLVQPK